MDGSRVVESEGWRLSVGWSRVVEFDERDGGFGESRVEELGGRLGRSRVADQARRIERVRGVRKGDTRGRRL